MKLLFIIIASITAMQLSATWYICDTPCQLSGIYYEKNQLVSASSNPSFLFFSTTEATYYSPAEFVYEKDQDSNYYINRVKTGTSGGYVVADVISERTSATGVTVDSVLLKDGAVTATGAVSGTTGTFSSVLTAASGSVTGTLEVGSGITIATLTPGSSLEVGVTGEIRWDASYIYVCTGANAWKRVAISGASW